MKTEKSLNSPAEYSSPLISIAYSSPLIFTKTEKFLNIPDDYLAPKIFTAFSLYQLICA